MATTPTTAILIDQFRASGVDCADIGAKLQDDCLKGSVGRVYLDTLYIEHWQDGRNGIAPPNGPTWLLTLGNEQTAGELAALETKLYQFALSEGYCDGADGVWGFRKEFPDFSAFDVPAFLLGSEWRDYSWHNDACPFFVHEASGVGVWADHSDPALRESGERFTATTMAWDDDDKGWNGWSHDISGGGVLFVTDSGDTLESSLPNFLPAYTIAHRFASAIEAYLSPDELELMREVNATLPAGICASHDFCDANMPMAEAFESVTGHQIDANSETDAALWSQAWDIAKANRLTAETGGGCRSCSEAIETRLLHCDECGSLDSDEA